MKNSAIRSLVLVLAVLTGGCGREPDTAGPSRDATPGAQQVAPAAQEVTPPAEKVAPPPEKLVTNSIGMKLVLIPSGEFIMGSPDSDHDATDAEKPPHRVRISEALYLGTYEVTQEQYERIMGRNPSTFKGDARRPVENVSWEQAKEFCGRLGRQEGKIYRLPTEAEWEYACRAGSTTRFSSADDEASLEEYAWLVGNSDGKTHPVGQKKPNAWGLYDVHGNVWEWCQDWWSGDYYASSPTDDPPGPAEGSSRVFRGGSWCSVPWGCRSAFRFWFTPVPRHSNLGFRVALVSE